MNWYGTWLEMRGGALYLGAVLVLSSVGMGPGDGGFRALTAETWLRLPWQEFFGPDLTELPLARTIGRDVLVWAEFAGRLPTIAFGGPIVFGLVAILGDKVSTSREPTFKWTAYALTLPISRASLVVGHFVASVALAVLCAATLLAVVHALVASGRSWWTLLTLPVLAALAIVPVHYIVAAPVRAEVPWAWLVACPLITCAAIGVTIARTKAREY
jgi:hypothetical protein